MGIVEIGDRRLEIEGEPYLQSPAIIQKKEPLMQRLCFLAYALTEIRTPVLSLKGLRPSPLDDEGNGWNSTIGRLFVKRLLSSSV